MTVAIAGYAALLTAILLVGAKFGVLGPALHGHEASGMLSFALLFAPYWFFGFGAKGLVRQLLSSPAKRLAGLAALTVPYLVFVIPRQEFRWEMFLALLFTLLALGVLLEFVPGAWGDFCALAVLAFAVELPFFRNAWPAPGLTSLSKLLFVDAGLFGYLVIRPIGGIGFDLHPRWIDLQIGLREFALYTPIALALGFLLDFLHWHGVGFPAVQFGAGWLFTLFFIALPEEIFFRGLMLNLIERRMLERGMGTRWALIVSSLIFGLAHFPKRAVFNWRYVILAAIAGVFYGRAWLSRRRVLTSGVTHATVDTIWSIWFR